MKFTRSAAALFAVSVCLLAGCFRQDIKTLVVRVPHMKSPECSKLIQDAMSRIEGIFSAEPDLKAGTMAVTYDSKRLSIKNIEYLITGLGFDANNEKGNPEARAKLPTGCRD
jgi:copper chaperone CopZ